MIQTSSMQNPSFLLRRTSILPVLLNILVIALSLLHHTGLHHLILGRITGFMILVVIFYNLGLIAVGDNYRDGSAAAEKLSTVFLILASTATFTLIVMQGDYVFPLIAYPVYYALFAIPAISSFHNLKCRRLNRTTAPPARNLRSRRFITAKSIYCIFMLVMFSVLSFVILTGGLPGQGLWWAIGSIAAGLGGLAIISIPASIILFLRQNTERLNRKWKIAIASYGIILTGICSLPLLSTPATIIDAGRQFAASFGPDWNTFEKEEAKIS